ncbi:MAG: hypothetical protein IGS50_00965 [Synechococcales cyanobacterium C42_A2020_086]|jgi:hypothetical protein|nr:hypothetical protein [Synechococcales cyanobacterium C42_A2020_086]
MLTQEFDQETEQYWTDLLAREQMTSEELLKTLIRERWAALQQSPSDQTADQTQTISDQTLPVASPAITPSDVTASAAPQPKQPKPKNPKQAIAEFVRKKAR